MLGKPFFELIPPIYVHFHTASGTKTAILAFDRTTQLSAIEKIDSIATNDNGGSSKYQQSLLTDETSENNNKHNKVNSLPLSELPTPLQVFMKQFI